MDKRDALKVMKVLKIAFPTFYRDYTADELGDTAAMWASMLGDYSYAAAIIAGLLVGIAIGKVTEIYTSGDYASVKKIAEQSQTGPATTIISGL